MSTLQGADLGADRDLAFWEAATYTRKTEGDVQSLLARWEHFSARGLPQTLQGYKRALHGLCLLHRSDLAKVRCISQLFTCSC